MNNVLKKALTAADVGVAIGSGSAFPYSFRKSSYISFSIGDVALSSASFILVSSNLQSLLTLTDLSETVFNRVKFNFVRLVTPAITVILLASFLLVLGKYI